MNLWKIAGVSFVILFSELLVIRLLGTEIRIFAYLGNLTLLVIFLGSGIGMYLKKPLPIYQTAIAFFLLAALTLTSYILRTPRFDVKLFSGISELLAPLSESYVWQSLNTYSKSGAVLGVGLTLGILGLVGWGFMPLGNLLGRLLKDSKQPLRAYSVNIAASLMGMWGLQIFSLAKLPPILGLAMVIWALVLLEEDRTSRIVILAAAMAFVGLSTPRQSFQPYEGPTTFWSPYQKLTLSLIQKTKIQQPPGYYLEVNNVGYMGLLNLGDEHQSTASAWLKNSGRTVSEDIPFLDQYLIPYRFKPNPEDVLIIGAGGGNDAYGAIRGGAKKIDAVEIDPVIVELGKNYHPNRPYQYPNVNLVTADGRAFMEKSQKKYDLIVMGLADSHTLSSSLTNLRLDHYLYTRESLEKTKQLLKPDGILILSFEVPREWIGQRLFKTVSEVFGYSPTTFEVRSDGALGWGGYFFVAAKNQQVLENILSANPELRDFVRRSARKFDADINALTDNWPYLYLDNPRLPTLHLIIAGVFMAGLFFARKTSLKKISFHWPMFWWGAGFMLFEFQNITKFGLLFGLTWQTNMMVISAALIMMFLANWLTDKGVISSRMAIIGLATALTVQTIIPIKLFNSLTDFPKIIAAGTILNLPFFFGGAIFSRWFKEAKNKEAAFASNLMGSAGGGLIEMFSFVAGIKAIIFAAAAMYSLGWIMANFRFGKIKKL